MGQYSPDGDSPCGAADMAGNVWEWTSSLHWMYPYDADDGREDEKATGPRVVRGGSFLNYLGLARCACRLRGGPRVRDLYLGFRVVVSPGSPA